MSNIELVQMLRTLAIKKKWLTKDNVMNHIYIDKDNVACIEINELKYSNMMLRSNEIRTIQIVSKYLLEAISYYLEEQLYKSGLMCIRLPYFNIVQGKMIVLDGIVGYKFYNVTT